MVLANLTKRYPHISFMPSNRFVWSPRNQTIYYDPQLIQTHQGSLALLHELSHALLGHETYEFDMELLNMEVEAWVKARELAPAFEVTISEDHIDNCLESYRVWLFKRSRCPNCNNTSLQEDESTYRCFNCQATWRVAQSKSLRPRRMSLQTA